MKKTIILIAVVVIIGSGLYWLQLNPPTPTNQNNTPAAESDQVTVHFTDQGYQPNSIRISAGTTVTFVNDSSRLMWPASDAHPTHQILPDFDAGRAVSPGDSYSHLFDKIGSWGLHDHLQPQLVGRITVE